MFVGNEENISFPPSQLAIWDDLTRKKIALIILKRNIIDFRVSKCAIFILLENKILIYETKSLRYIMTIQDVDSYIDKFTTTSNYNPLVVAHISASNKSMIKSYKFKYDENYIIDKKCQFLIITAFNDTQYLQLNEKVNMY
jgi:hypothetical protein